MWNIQNKAGGMEWNRNWFTVYSIHVFDLYLYCWGFFYIEMSFCVLLPVEGHSL